MRTLNIFSNAHVKIKTHKGKKQRNVKHLGVLVSSDGFFSNRINKISKTSRSISSWIIKKFQNSIKNCNAHTMAVVGTATYGILFGSTEKMQYTKT